jgi:2TM domain
MKPPAAAWRDRLVRGLRWHARGVAALNLGLTAVNIATGRPWWGLWPLLATGLVLGVHYMLAKAFTIDERWVEERARDLAIKSYDRSHIESIRDRQQQRDA